MQNKANFPDDQMNVTAVNTMNNELRTMNYFVQNKANRTQFQTAQHSRPGPNAPFTLEGNSSRPCWHRHESLAHDERMA
jgi:hypothetical protein